MPTLVHDAMSNALPDWLCSNADKVYECSSKMSAFEGWLN